MRNGGLAGGPGMGGVTRGCVFSQLSCRPPGPGFAGLPTPSTGPMGVEHPLGDCGALFASLSVTTTMWTQLDCVCRGACSLPETYNSAGVDAVGTLGVVSGTEVRGPSAGRGEEPCPHWRGPLGQLPPPQLGFVSTHSSTVVAQSRGACPGRPAFLVWEEATASCSRASAGWKRLINLISQAD